MPTPDLVAEICVGEMIMKIVFIFMLALVSLQIQSQKIHIDKQDGNVRKMLTYSKKFTSVSGGFMGSRSLSLALGVNCLPNDTIYLLGISHTCTDDIKDNRPTIEIGRKLIFVCDNDSIVILSNYNEVGASDYTFEVDHSHTRYTITPIYKISKDNLLFLINNKVRNIRMETDVSRHDFYGDKFSATLKKEYETIKQSFKYKKGILDGLDMNKVRKN